MSMCCRSLQDVQIWFQPNAAARFAPFLPRSDSQDAFGESASVITQWFPVFIYRLHAGLKSFVSDPFYNMRL